MGKHNGARVVAACRGTVFRAVLLLSTGLVTACGATTTFGGAPEATTTTVAATTTTTMPPTTTTTIDFARPVDQADTPLAEEATIGEVAELVQDMRGQTDSVSEQLSRLVTFPKLASPVGSQILDFTLSIQAIEGGYLNQSMVRFRAPADAGDVVNYFESELVSRGWNMSDFSAMPTDQGMLTTLVFRIPGMSGEEEELEIALDVRPGVVMIVLSHHTNTDEEDPRFTPLHAWQDVVRLPSSAEVIEAGITTADNVGTATVVHRLDAATAADARTATVNLVRDNEYLTDAVAGENDASSITLTDVETGQQFTLSFSGTDQEDAIDVAVSATFALTPID